MKKTCERFCALRLIDGYSCALNFKIDTVRGIPLEECPKHHFYGVICSGNIGIQACLNRDLYSVTLDILKIPMSVN
jgi:hypothetical protein